MNSTGTEWSRTTKYVVGVGVILLGIYLIRISSEVIPLLIVAALLAVITRPIIAWLMVRLNLKRGLAVAIVYMGVVVLFPLALLLAIPAIVNAVQYVLGLDYQGFMRGGLEWLRSTLMSIRTTRLPVESLDIYVDQMLTDLLASLQNADTNGDAQAPSVSTILRSLSSALTTTFSTVTSVVGSVFSNLVLFIFIFLVSIYMSLGAHAYRDAFLRALPPAYQPEINTLLGRIGRMWGAFFRGQLILMLVIGVFTWLGLTALGIPGALYLGIIAGLLELIPNLGPIIAAVPAVIVTLLQGSSYLPVNNLVMAAIVIAFCILVQQLENNIIVPRVLGGAVNLPPLVVITGVLVGTTAFGLLGALLATPMIATVREILRYIYGKMTGTDPYPPEEAVVAPAAQTSSGPRQWLNGIVRWAKRFADARKPLQPPPMKDPVERMGKNPEEKTLPQQKNLDG